MTAADTTSSAKVSAPSTQTKPRRRGLSDKAIVSLFIWPTLILLIVLNVFPLMYSLYLSLHQLFGHRAESARLGGIRELQEHPDRRAVLAVLRHHRPLCVVSVGIES